MSKPEDSPPKRDYRATLFLPATDFPMKAGLAAAEPQWLARWEKLGLYRRQRAAAKGRTRFMLHDGPPYANGDIHIGTALNKILKDFVVRSQTMLGRDAPYVPGWDCHGLPIEWKIEEQYRAKGKSKDEAGITELRAECRAFAQKWIGIQREQFQRLGCIGDWEHPYTTMAFAAEAQIVRELHKFLMNGLLYRGARPVMWSVVEKTALAEAEIEYQEKSSPAVYVGFPVLRSNLSGLMKQPTEIVIWTTTPWTIPGNRAIAYSPSVTYCIVRARPINETRRLPITANDLSSGEREAAHISALTEDEYARNATAIVEEQKDFISRIGDRAFVVAKSLFHDFRQAIKAPMHTLDEYEFSGALLKGTVCAHPLRGKGYDFDVPLLPGEHVTEDEGTGFVHTAPGHGEDDFALAREHDIEIPRTVDEEGKFYADVPLFAGKRVLTPDGKEGDANGAVIRELIAVGALLAKGTLRHQYPHSWRSKAPIITRTTPQWFIAVDKEFDVGERSGTLRELALAAIRDTRWVPKAGENRISAMVKERPDWVLSRQRAWGVPIAVFVAKKGGQLLRDPAVNARIAEIFAKEGADAWFNSPPARFLGNAYQPSDYEQIGDILDVWFESGTTHAFVVEEPIDLSWPHAGHADLYLEGSDQHRGWFQSSLLESCGTRGRAPYDAVLTHGFVLDEQGRKMSKSLGNTVAPQSVAEKNGAEILRLWAANSDFTEDLRIGPEIIQANVDAYRRLRNTIRFLLANLAGFDESERVERGQMPELERFMLACLAELDAEVRHGYGNYDFNHVYTTLFNFATNDLSAFYFDTRKDALYCDAKSSVRRRAARTVLDALFARLTVWLAPILCFTMEEAWLMRFPGENESVHLQPAPATPKDWIDEALLQKWARLRTLRRIVTGALELERKNKTIGASLEAAPTLFVESASDVALFADVDLAEIAITSAAKVVRGAAPESAFRLPDVSGAGVVFARAEGTKCARCWMILTEVGENRTHPDLCRRCSKAVGP